MKTKKNIKEGAVDAARDDSQVETLSSPRNYTVQNNWLKSIIGEDQVTTQRQMRCLLAEQFLLTILYPLLQQKVNITQDILVAALIEFKKEYTTVGIDFEISNVTGRLLERFDCYVAEEFDPTADNAETFNRDIELFIILGDLDLTEVDERVKKALLKNVI
ncbi:MAG TPA: hypothetical protein PKJ84_00125 [Anaerolineales bacterium]|nr:hypothetical protein [Anaerolineales bacterium]HNO92542.1 hypothetical protein [Anaerolineales bacterium]